ncbi:L-aspartate oxidase [Candidatus Methylacidiphilum infernorum]|uniref:L-aspartate oxidase n=1 Tax=Methylacidiphilum infernorum (isolate V4) TaxID=481448 RepID=B3DUH9_METI4|nr:L-aspartate oxidase [Candidatus Methylacidiphilum infernorum]ACD82982.1 Aspartate oxidase [Methylacidiphilum infernorum V4]
MEKIETDYLVIGGGIAGLFFALEASRFGQVAVLLKNTFNTSSSWYAQGGISCVGSSEDTFESHISDTLKAGDGLCDAQVVKSFVEEAPQRINDLIRYGVPFSKDEKGNYDLGLEAGHSHRRIYHVKDHTGMAIIETLKKEVLQRSRITLWENHLAVDLIISQNGCFGAYVYDKETNRLKAFLSAHTLLSTGGCGALYLHTTNPSSATGDGIAMAYRAGAILKNMEMIQFHPTCFFQLTTQKFLISEAVRGEGAKIINPDGKSFLQAFDPRAELAPRDIVSRAIFMEMKAHHYPYVFLDIRGRQRKWLEERFPYIFSFCLSQGIDMSKDLVPVAPAAHYQCGGVATDAWGRTSIPGLWAAGEVACTGFHGANRLASNSLLEAVIVAGRAARLSAEEKRSYSSRDLFNIKEKDLVLERDCKRDAEIKKAIAKIREVMWENVGIVRCVPGLKKAQKEIEFLIDFLKSQKKEEAMSLLQLEAQNIALTASIVVESALRRKESRGAHWVSDYPQKQDVPKDTLISFASSSV